MKRTLGKRRLSAKPNVVTALVLKQTDIGFVEDDEGSPIKSINRDTLKWAAGNPFLAATIPEGKLLLRPGEEFITRNNASTGSADACFFNPDFGVARAVPMRELLTENAHLYAPISSPWQIGLSIGKGSRNPADLLAKSPQKRVKTNAVVPIESPVVTSPVAKKELPLTEKSPVATRESPLVEELPMDKEAPVIQTRRKEPFMKKTPTGKPTPRKIVSARNKPAPSVTPRPLTMSADVKLTRLHSIKRATLPPTALPVVTPNKTRVARSDLRSSTKRPKDSGKELTDDDGEKIPSARKVTIKS